MHERNHGALAVKVPDINECQICGAPAPPITGQCEEVTGYRLLRDPWAPKPSFLDGNLHFSCLTESDQSALFFDEFTRMLRAGHEEVASLDGSFPPLTRMGLGMTQIFSGTECCVFQSRVADRWVVVKRTGPWFRLALQDVTELGRSITPNPPSDVVPYRLPVDLDSDVRELSLPALLSALKVADRYEPDFVEYEVIDYYPPKLLLEYVARAPLRLPEEAVAFLSAHIERYTPVRHHDE
ncbi:hypothetical protein [Streptomyces olivaceus]|uniref:hypothetical protein n=1 Tax=Streptomyces olivaceus TaxID=47716 RepID=UPI001CCB4CE3|nr:hypothetical protein [Streptomyces olivaceus]